MQAQATSVRTFVLVGGAETTIGDFPEHETKGIGWQSDRTIFYYTRPKVEFATSIFSKRARLTA